MPRVIRSVALALIVGLGGFAARAGDDKDEKKTVDIQVLAIRATTKNKDISPELKGIADVLKKQFKFTGFKLEKKETGSKTPIGKAYNLALPGGYQINVTPKSSDGKKVELQVEVLKGKERKLNATYTLEAGKFQLQGGWDLDGGDALIVAVSGR